MSRASNPSGLKYIGQGIATIAAAGVCGVMIWKTGGAEGIGWFVCCLIVIW